MDNKIVDELAKDPTVSEMYNAWNKINWQKLSVYSQKDKLIVPLSENDEFRSIKNVILKKAVFLSKLTQLDGHSKEYFQHSISTTCNGLANILARLIGANFDRKFDNLESQVDSKLREMINEKKAAHGLKTSYTVVTDDDEDEDQNSSMIL